VRRKLKLRKSFGFIQFISIHEQQIFSVILRTQEKKAQQIGMNKESKNLFGQYMKFVFFSWK